MSTINQEREEDTRILHKLVTDYHIQTLARLDHTELTLIEAPR